MAVLAAVLVFGMQVSAYNVVDLPESMTFADALGIFSADDIESASISDIEGNTFKNLTAEEVGEFYDIAADMTVWRKINPTPFRGACVNFTAKDGTKISYYFNSGIQIGRYGVDNYVCYMPARDDAVELSYLESEFYDSEEGVYGGAVWNVCTDADFLKLPQDEWAIAEVQVAAAKSLVPYEFTDKYGSAITREQLAVLLENAIAVAGNYGSMDAYLEEQGIGYTTRTFADCAGRNAAIDRLCAVGIISGKTSTTFDPDGLVTRQEAAAMLTRVADLFIYVGTNGTASFADSSSIDPWARFYVNWTAEKGVMSGVGDNRFDPKGTLTVQQAIVSVNRLSNLITYWGN